MSDLKIKSGSLSGLISPNDLKPSFSSAAILKSPAVASINLVPISS
jgi:hypothetical protein